MLCRVSVFMMGLLCMSQAVLAQNGIYAVFNTSMGSFTCGLDYTNAPITVANFIGLATGQRGWIDDTTGNRRTNAFYDGLTFHRVIAGFMIQGGSRNGLGTDGPGYQFVDEFTNLTFNAVGKLAMANSGPDSNGSQIFVTVAPTTWLNGIHTIFGNVVTNYSVVSNISKVVTDANNKPLTNVVVNSVKILRQGTAATNFNINAYDLPVVTNLSLKISNAPPYVRIGFTNRLHSENRLFYSGNLSHWTNASLGVETVSAQSQWLTQTNWPASGWREFYKLAQAQYASTRPAPQSLNGLRIAFEFANGLGTNTTTFDNAGGGTYTWPTQGVTTSTPVRSYFWKLDPYRGRLRPIEWDGIYPMDLHLSFLTTSNGTFTGTVRNPNNDKVSGDFRFK
jgi:peptidyl-prolyl cis-trans isomerase A (cyclophilin A)